MIFSVVGGLSEVSSVILTLNGIQDIIHGVNFLLYAILLPCSALTFIISKRISQTQTAYFTESLLNKLYIEIIDDIRQNELEDVEKLNTSEIYSKMLNAQIITDSAVKGVHCWQNLIVILFLWLYIFNITPTGGLFCLLLISIAVAVYQVSQQLMAPLIKTESEQEKELSSLFNHILYGAKEIRINQQKNNDLFDNWLIPVIKKVKEIRADILSYFSRYWIFTCFCVYFGMAFIAFCFPLSHSNDVTISVIIIIIYVWTPLLGIVGSMQRLTEGRNAIDNLYDMRNKRKLSRKKKEQIFDEINNFSELKFNNVGYRYKNPLGESEFSIGPLNFSCKAGEIIIIAGGNGSGKTTLMKIITGLYFPDSGKISINGNSVDMMNHRYLFSSVFSDFHLFDTMYGIDDIDENTVNKLLKETDLSNKTQWISKEKRFRHIDLSTGQRKRLALIVSLLEDKPIYIFDEWAADQDPHFRGYFYETLLPYLKNQGKLIIAVSHDDRYFHIADRLIKMEYGHIIYNQAPEEDFFLDMQTMDKLKVTDQKQKYVSEKPQQKENIKPTLDEPILEKDDSHKKNEIEELLQSSFKKKSRILIFNGIFSVLCPPFMFGILFTSANIAQKETITRNFFIFLILLILYMVTYKEFSNSLIWFVEEWIANIRMQFMKKIRKTDYYSFEKLGIEKIQTALNFDI